MTHNNQEERSVEVEAFNFQALKEYWALHIGPKSSQHMQEKVLFKIHEKLKNQHHHQLQKARQDWLREEIERLEGMDLLNDYHDKSHVIQTITDRYNAELDSLPTQVTE